MRREERGVCAHLGLGRWWECSGYRLEGGGREEREVIIILDQKSLVCKAKGVASWQLLNCTVR